MYLVNDIVLYNQTDVCRITDIRKMPFPGETAIDCYALKPLYDEASGNSTVYVPVNAGEERIRRMFSADELKQMLESGNSNIQWIESAMIRKKVFSDILSRNHPAELLSLIRLICAKRSEKQRAGQRFSELDEKLLTSALRRLHPLFRYILNVEWDDFLPMLINEGDSDAAKPGHTGQ